MVRFEAEVYKNTDESITGVQVIISDDVGEVIDTIQVTNKMEFDELVAKLNTLNEDYVQFDEDSLLKGRVIDELLLNSSEEVNINATTLSGFQSDDFSKMGHTHVKSAITDLYNYDISLDKYNVNLNETVSVTVKVTDMNNSPVSNHHIILYVNNELWEFDAFTDSAGEYTAIFTPTEKGIVTFAVGNQKVQCFVDVSSVWKIVPLLNGGAYGTLYVNENIRVCELRYNREFSSGQADTSYTWHNNAIPSNYRPGNQVTGGLNYLGVLIVGSDGNIGGRFVNEFHVNRTIRSSVMWHY